MPPKNTPYPFDDIPDENYFGEFRELLSSTGSAPNKDNEMRHDNTDISKSDDAFNGFPIFPNY